MPLPLIGLTTYNQENRHGYPIAALMHQYIRAIGEAGGVPVLIPSGLDRRSIQSLTARLDGFLFTGGGDIQVSLYGGRVHPRLTDLDPARDALELELAKSVTEAGKPFLGICRGFQLINVAFGGSLYEDIADQMAGAIKHAYDSATERTLLAHEVRIEPTSRLGALLGERRLQVNSLHHQGARDVPPPLRPVAFAPDGLVEALELENYPFGVAVQWHPEWLTDQPAARRLFRAFVLAGRGEKQ
ncbi:MAG: gamma-glutamyl-gamma-aminobutyrate hydrolase family protein [Anaerolineales bacterium]